MKKIFLSYITACMLLACTNNQPMTVTVSNPLDIDRSGEMVEVSMDEISNRLKLADTAQIVVLDAEGTEIPYQICLLYTSPSPRDAHESRMPSSA